MQQFNPSLNIEDQQLQPIDLSLLLLRELGAKWIVKMAGYFANNPDIIVKGFIWSGISRALDDVDTESDEEEIDSDDNGYSEASSDEETSDEETPENTSESQTVSLERKHSIIVLSD